MVVKLFLKPQVNFPMLLSSASQAMGKDVSLPRRVMTDAETFVSVMTDVVKSQAMAHVHVGFVFAVRTAELSTVVNHAGHLAITVDDKDREMTFGIITGTVEQFRAACASSTSDFWAEIQSILSSEVGR